MIRKGISVQELIFELEQYNPNASVSILAYGAIHPFSITYGHNLSEAQDGLVTKENCDNVTFYLEDIGLKEKGGVG